MSTVSLSIVHWEASCPGTRTKVIRAISRIAPSAAAAQRDTLKPEAGPSKRSSPGITAPGTQGAAGKTQEASQEHWFVICQQVQGQRIGLLLAGFAGPTAIPAFGGTLCLTPPIKRTAAQHSSGTAGAGDGQFHALVNDCVGPPGGLDPGPGQTAWYQWWYRDPEDAANPVALSTRSRCPSTSGRLRLLRWRGLTDFQPESSMPKSSPFVLCLVLLTSACAATAPDEPQGPPIVDADPERRDPLFDAVAGLEGRWQLVDEGMPGVIEYAVTAGGHSVREVMFPGEPHEMVNMYSLDGNSLVMTHYCAAGNQPRMRALSFGGRHLPFGSDGVSDLKSPDEGG